METKRTNNEMELISRVYMKNQEKLVCYILKRTSVDRTVAEDMAQDVFVRIMDFAGLICESTVESFVFSIARNMVIDHLRSRARRNDAMAYYTKCLAPDEADNTDEAQFTAAALARSEREKVAELPAQRRRVYEMSRFEGMSIPEIADRLELSPRTVGTHLQLGRSEVRTYLKAIGYGW